MKRFLLFCFLVIASIAQSQGTYYWVGGAPITPQTINNVSPNPSNWNTSLDGSGTPRSSNSTADVLIFDGRNYGGATPTTGTDSVTITGGVSCAQLRFQNGARIILNRTSTGTGTLTILGDGTAGTDDFFIAAGSSLTIANGSGSVVIVMGAATNSGLVNGDFSMVTGQQARIANGTSTTTRLVFAPGSTFTTNITGSATYAFGNTTQSTEKWVQFQAGSTCYYDGGNSMMASSSTFQPVSFLTGSNFVMRNSNPIGSGGSFFNRKGYANITVQNGATLTADGPINQIDTLTITSGSTFTTHTAGQTVVLGDLVVHGNLSAPASSTNEIVMAGSALQNISGSGIINIPSLFVTDGANVMLNKNVSVIRSATIAGKMDFGTSQLTGAGTFAARMAGTSTSVTGNTTAGSYILTGVAGASGFPRGVTISAAGLQPNTRVISYTTNFDSIYISRPATGTAVNTTLSLSATPATLVTANASGFDPVNGSVVVTDVKNYSDGINYTINASTTTPFGITTGSTIPYVNIGNLQFNAAATTNITAYVSGTLEAANSKVTIRPLDTLHLLPGASLAGTYNSNVYFVTSVNAAGDVGVFTKHNTSGSTLFPIGTAANYLPATVNPVNPSYFALNVFQGITTNGTPAGTAFTSLQKQTVVDAVWNVNRLTGTGDANLKLQWTAALEGTTLATFANTEIGIIKNTGSAWTLPFGIGDNATNTADTTFNSFGQYSVGARPPANPFVFNPLPTKTYGDADFSPGVISSNTTQPINYSSSNTSVATIVGGNIHIVGTGTTSITATQASDGFYPAANVSQTLTVNKASLTIKADRKVKPEGDPNPPLTATYTGFVLGETQAVFLTPAVLSTTATTVSPPGSYLITVSGATAANYTITFVNDSLIIRPRTAQTITFPAFATKTYGNADFAIGASSSNNTIPITYASSNTGVATIVGNNIHIVAAGTAIITASQAGNDLFFPATPVSQALTINKAPLTIRVADTTKQYSQPNPLFRIVYTGFVLGETSAVFTTQPTINTTATTNSAPGYYLLQPAGAVAANYNISYVNGRLTIFPATGTGAANVQAFMSNSGTLTVRVFSPAPDLGDIFIYDINGRPIEKKNIFIAAGFITTTFAVNGLPAGIYVVQVIGTKTKLKTTLPILH